MPLSEESRQQAVSKQFLRLHKDDFAACEANAAIIADYMEQNRLPWTLDSLEIAYEVVKDRLAPVAKSSAELAAENAAIQARVEADAKKVIEQEAINSLPGAGITGIPQFTTVAEIHEIPRDEYRRLYHSNAFGELFRARVNEVYARSGKKYVMGKF
jgi:hypothetical protein